MSQLAMNNLIAAAADADIAIALQPDAATYRLRAQILRTSNPEQVVNQLLWRQSYDVSAGGTRFHAGE